MTATARTAPGHRVPVIRFRAGELHFAVAADSIAAVSTAPGAAPGDGPGEARHLASVIGEVVTPPAAAQRRVRIRHRDAAADLVVDGPVAMAHVTVREIIPIKSGIARAGFVLGFARLGDDVVELLDVAMLLEAARRDATPARPASGPEAPAGPDDRDLRESP